MGSSIELIDDSAPPYEGGTSLARRDEPRSMIEAEITRAQQEAQAGFLVAKQFPRDEMHALERIVRSCQRPSLAERATYAFPRGGQQVTGPSIRLAEVLAQQWGNINFGYRELAEGPGMTMVLAYAYDLETNTRAEKVFHVKHVRDTKAKGTQTITDRRDLYELIANQAARRIRSCILQIIPGDVTEAAIEAAQAALERHEGDNIEERQKRLLAAFEKLEVTADMIERRMGKKIKALLPADIVVLRNIYRSLSDGMSSVEQWFESDAVARAKEAVAKATKEEEPKPEPKKKAPPKKAQEAPEPAPEPEPPQGTPEPPDEQDAAAGAQPEPEPDEPEDEPESTADGPTDEEVLEAISVNVRPGRQSNLQIQLEERLVKRITDLMATGLAEEDAGQQAAREVYAILTEQFGAESVNTLELRDRPAFLHAVADLVKGGADA